MAIHIRRREFIGALSSAAATWPRTIGAQQPVMPVAGLGHAIPGIEGVYDRHAYTKEKAEALAKPAAMIEQIINPPEQTNVVPLRAS